MIVKSSELTRTRREGGRRNGKEGENILMGSFLATKSRYQGPQGRKVQNQARKMGGGGDKTNKKTKAEWLMERPLGAGHRRAVSSLCAIGTRVARTRLCSVVTEWVLAGQQTAICKHHEGKHQSTLDFFLFFSLFFYNFFFL